MSVSIRKTGSVGSHAATGEGPLGNSRQVGSLKLVEFAFAAGEREERVD
jgi:hypothetical protein